MKKQDIGSWVNLTAIFNLIIATEKIYLWSGSENLPFFNYLHTYF